MALFDCFLRFSTTSQGWKSCIRCEASVFHHREVVGAKEIQYLTANAHPLGIEFKPGIATFQRPEKVIIHNVFTWTVRQYVFKSQYNVRSSYSHNRRYRTEIQLMLATASLWRRMKQLKPSERTKYVPASVTMTHRCPKKMKSDCEAHSSKASMTSPAVVAMTSLCKAATLRLRPAAALGCM